jgi:hypothetical protein
MWMNSLPVDFKEIRAALLYSQNNTGGILCTKKVHITIFQTFICMKTKRDRKQYIPAQTVAEACHDRSLKESMLRSLTLTTSCYQ